ncbi:MAG: hypothetical protein GY847_40530 [Proteobacteria bacterium]|nr:hypothetical protein [Pseudomonadota bacterium]
MPPELLYRGIRLRSTLEGRWAVFLHELGIQYEALGASSDRAKEENSSYLPSFRLPELDVYLEIVPDFSVSLDRLEVITDFALDADERLLLAAGSPSSRGMLLIDRTTCSPLASFKEEYAEVDESPSPRALVAAFIEDLSDWAQVTIGPQPFSRGWTVVYHRLPPSDEAAISSAITAARGAFWE